MLYLKTQSSSMPQAVNLERLPEGPVIVRLAANIHEAETEDEISTIYEYDEVIFQLPDDRAEETAESIQADFSAWWEYGQQAEEEEVTIEDRLSALEDMIFEILGV